MKSAFDSADATRFATTRWHLILQPRDAVIDESSEAAALAHLAQTYWRPISAVIFRRGYSPDDAQDLTQDFFLEISSGKLLRVADPERGRFRCLLLRALQNFLADTAAKRTSIKRGGQFEFLPWERWIARAAVELPLPLHALRAWPDERLFDAGWAAALAAEALRLLRIEYESNNRRAEFDILSPHLTSDRAEISYGALGEALAASPELVKRSLRQIRLRYRMHLRREVAATVSDPTQVEDEIRYLCAALCAAPR